MTRIVSGKWRGRRLTVPTGSPVRPTAERVREAWLSILGPELDGARLVDLFAGTGALGLEGLSRGAASCDFVEQHSRTRTVLNANVAALDAAGQSRVIGSDVHRFVAGLVRHSYDIALADPPFAGDDAERLVAAWRDRPFARILAVEHHPRSPLTGSDTRRWGDIAVTFFREE